MGRTTFALCFVAPYGQQFGIAYPAYCPNIDIFVSQATVTFLHGKLHDECEENHRCRKGNTSESLRFKLVYQIIGFTAASSYTRVTAFCFIFYLCYY